MDRIAFKWNGRDRLDKGIYYISTFTLRKPTDEIEGLVEMTIEDYNGNYVDTLRFEHLKFMELGTQEYVSIFEVVENYIKNALFGDITLENISEPRKHFEKEGDK